MTICCFALALCLYVPVRNVVPSLKNVTEVRLAARELSFVRGIGLPDDCVGLSSRELERLLVRRCILERWTEDVFYSRLGRLESLHEARKRWVKQAAKEHERMKLVIDAGVYYVALPKLNRPYVAERGITIPRVLARDVLLAEVAILGLGVIVWVVLTKTANARYCPRW